MRPPRRRLIVIGLALLVLASVSLDCGRVLRVVDTNGSPVRTVLIVYHREGGRLNLHPQTYQASAPSVLEGGPDGRVWIRPSIYMHLPFPLETHPTITVDLVFAPLLHNGLATIRDRAILDPGGFRVDDDLATVTLSDLAENPFLWQGTMMNVSSMIERLLAKDARQLPRAKTVELRLLIGYFTAEYQAYLARYGDVFRPRPEMPDVVRLGTVADKQAWEAMVDRDLAREPRWGNVARRLFASEVERLSRER